MRDFVESQFWVGRWKKEICIICVFEDTVSGWHKMKIGSHDQIRHWSEAISLDDTCFHLCDRRTLTSISCTMTAVLKTVFYPVRDTIWTISCTILLMNVAWRTLSNTFVKSKDRTWTKSLVDNMVQTVCNRAMTAAVVEPLGLKANWSSKLSPGGGCCSAG